MNIIHGWRIFSNKINANIPIPVQLNEELDLIKGYLTGYLKFVLQNQIKPELIKGCIRKTIYEPFKARDISNEGKEAFLQFVDERWKKAENKENTERSIFSRKYGYSFKDMESDIEYYKKVTNNLLSNHITNVETTQPIFRIIIFFPTRYCS